MDDNKKLKIAYKYCKPLRVECIKQELEEQLEGYNFKSIERKNGKWATCFEDWNGNHINLFISSTSFSILKTTSIRIDRITIDKKLLLTHRVVDKRPNGAVYSIIKKQFASSSNFNKIVLTGLIEQRFALTRNKINSLCKEVDFDNLDLTYLFLKLRELETKIDLKSQSDYYSNFSTYINYYFNCNSGRKIIDNIYSTRTYVNDEDVSSIFDIDGSDKLYRIYDLYNGIINSRNENDINSIHLGFLSQDVFNLKELKGISKQEDSLVGTSLENISNTYINYLKNFFDQKFGYKGNIGLDRDSMLLGITYRMSGIERFKRDFERKSGISYNKFEQLNFYSQRQLIDREKSNKNRTDLRFIDGIPMNIITREQIDRQIDELTDSSPKKILRRLLSPFNKK